jgi:hypothetical protein
MIYDSPWKVLLILIFWVVPIGIAGMVGGNKGRRGLGYLLGLLLGWIGVIVMLFVPKTHEQEVRNAARRMQIEQEARRARAPGVERQAHS